MRDTFTLRKMVYVSSLGKNKNSTLVSLIWRPGKESTQNMMGPEINTKSGKIQGGLRTLQHILPGRIHTACSVFHNPVTGGTGPDCKT